MRHVLLILSALLSFTVHASGGIGCVKDFVGSKLVVGTSSAWLEAKAERLALAEFNRTVGQNQGQAKDVETLISLKVTLGLMMYVIGIQNPKGEPETYAVFVSEREYQVTRLDTNRPPSTDEDSPERRIECAALRAASIKFPPGTDFRGTWPTGAPKVTRTATALVIPTGIDEGVVLIDVLGANAEGPTVLHAVAEIREGQLLRMSELQSMTHEQNWGSSPRVETPASVATDGLRGTTETHALMAVLTKILELQPTARVSAATAESLNTENTIFTVTATRTVSRPRGSKGTRSSVYQVTVDARGELVVTHIAEQG